MYYANLQNCCKSCYQQMCVLCCDEESVITYIVDFEQDKAAGNQQCAQGSGWYLRWERLSG